MNFPRMEQIDKIKSLKRELPVVNLPTIHEIETVHQSSRINFEIIKTNRNDDSSSEEEEEENVEKIKK